ncbi:MAG TPA: cupin domain-containing protein [Chloroflexota bacterium]|nr:cupin domain-containing protein [Chloroflexota bacterium]
MKNGGENQLHAHRAQDATWVVLEGQVTFYGEDHQEVARLNARDGLFIPRATPYYFCSSGDETAVIMRVSARATDVPNERLDYERAFDAAAS